MQPRPTVTAKVPSQLEVFEAQAAGDSDGSRASESPGRRWLAASARACRWQMGVIVPLQKPGW